MGYVKKRKNFKELRISECIFRDENSLSIVFKTIEKLSVKFGVHFISYSPQVLNVKPPGLIGKYGPILTLRDLNIKFNNRVNFLNVKSWQYSLGDLELF